MAGYRWCYRHHSLPGERTVKNFIFYNKKPTAKKQWAFYSMGRDPVELAKRAKYKPPAMRVRGVCYTKKSPFRYNEVVQAKT